MLFDTFGNINNKKCLFIHGMLSSGKSMIPYTKYFDSYYVINVTLDGHHENSEIVADTKIEVGKIIEFLKSQKIDEIELLHGTSLGARFAFEFAFQNEIKINHFFFDGGPFINVNNFLCKILTNGVRKQIKSYISRSKDELLNDPSISCFIQNSNEDFDTIYNDYMVIFNNYLKEDSLDRLTNMAYKFSFPKVDDDSKFTFFVSKGEPVAKFIKKVKKTYPNSHYIIWDGKEHCEFQNKNPKDYALMVLESLK